MEREVIQAALREPGVESLGLSPARALLARARAESAELFSEARQKGFLAGLERLQGELSAFESARKEFFADAAEEIVALALLVAAEALGEALKLQPESLKSRVLRAAALLGREGALSLHAHPDDLSWLRPIEERLAAAHGVRLVADPAMTRGCARFLSARGAWELDPYEHLRRMKEELRQTERAQ